MKKRFGIKNKILKKKKTMNETMKKINKKKINKKKVKVIKSIKKYKKVINKNIKRAIKKPIKKINKKVSQKIQKEVFVVDTSILAAKKITELIEKKGMRGRIIIPDAAVAELEHQANQGREIGFKGLEVLAKLHSLKHRYDLKIEFAPPRPTSHEIRFAKSGEIDALIRSLAYGKSATLVTSDFIQAKSAAAYGIKVWFVRATPKKEIKRFSFFKFR